MDCRVAYYVILLQKLKSRMIMKHVKMDTQYYVLCADTSHVLI